MRRSRARSGTRSSTSPRSPSTSRRRSRRSRTRARHWTYISSLSVYAADVELDADETRRRMSPRCPARSTTTGARRRRPRHPSARSRRSRGDRAAGPHRRPWRPDRPLRLLGGGSRSPGASPCSHRRRGRDRAGDRRRRPRGLHRRARRRALARRRERDRRHVALGELLALARETAGHTGHIDEADDEWLTAHEVAHWSGPRSLPLWLPARHAGLATRSIAAYRAAGGRLRDLRETLERTLADERERGLERERKAGLTRPDELELLADLA